MRASPRKTLSVGCLLTEVENLTNFVSAEGSWSVGVRRAVAPSSRVCGEQRTFFRVLCGEDSVRPEALREGRERSSAANLMVLPG